MAICFEVERSVPKRMTEDGERLAQALRDLRTRAGITQEEMADRIGLSYAGYRPYEQGRRELKPSQLPRFAEALEISTAELASRIGLIPESVHNLRVNEFSEIITRVEAEAPQIADDLMEMIRTSFRIAIRARPSQRNLNDARDEPSRLP